MKKSNNKLIKFTSIFMIVIAAYNFLFKIFLAYQFRIFGAPPYVQIMFFNSFTMLILGIMSIKNYNDSNKNTILCILSGVQTILCLLVIVMMTRLWAYISYSDIVQLLSLLCSLILLIHYIQKSKK